MSPAPRKSAGGLKAKKMGLPIWAWGALGLVAVGVFIYMKRQGSSSSTGTTATDTLAGQASTGTDTTSPSVGGQPTDSSLGSQGITQADLNNLGQQIQDALNSAVDAAGAGIGAGGFSGSGVDPGSTADNGSGGTSTGDVAAASAKTANGFWWGGSYYGPGGKSFAQFKAWEKAHGGSVNQVFLAQHPGIERAFSLPVLPPPPAQRPRAAAAPRRAPAPHGRPAPKRVTTKRAPRARPRTIVRRPR